LIVAGERLPLRYDVGEPADIPEALLSAVAFDPQAEQYTYRVNTGFGRATPTQLSLNQQLQVQIGACSGF
jgi:hypothetical protein